MKQTKKEILDKLNAIAKPADTWLVDAKFRLENRDWLKHSQATALKILRTLRAQGKTQKDLAIALDVSPQQVNKWVKGKENFTYETIGKIEAALDIRLVEVPVEPKSVDVIEIYKEYPLAIVHSKKNTFRRTSKSYTMHRANTHDFKTLEPKTA